MSEDERERQDSAEDASEDLALDDEAAEDVTGGQKIKLSPGNIKFTEMELKYK